MFGAKARSCTGSVNVEKVSTSFGEYLSVPKACLLVWHPPQIDYTLNFLYLPPSRHLWVFVHLHLPAACPWALIRAHGNHWTARLSRLTAEEGWGLLVQPGQGGVPGDAGARQLYMYFISGEQIVLHSTQCLGSYPFLENISFHGMLWIYLGLHWDKFITSCASYILT